MKKCLVVMTILALVAVLTVGCTGATSPMPTPTSPTSAPAPTLPAGMGTLEVRVTDAPPEYGTIKEILVTVVDSEEAIMVHKAVAEQEQLGEGDQNQVQNQVQQGEGEWINIPIIGENTFELLELKEKGVDLLLGWAEVPAGKYTQIRMTIKEVKIIFDDETEDGREEVAELPSGKLKFVRPFEVVDGGTTIILLDFIADKSVTITGQGKVIFKPVIKLSIQQASKPHELTSVEGTISAVDTDESTVSIIPEGGAEEDTIVLSVNPQTEITLDGEGATLEDLDELGEGNSVTASYYLNNLKATQIDVES